MVEIKATADISGKIHVTDIPENWSYDLGTKNLRMFFNEEGHRYMVEGDAHIIPANVKDEDAWIATLNQKNYLLYKSSEKRIKKKYYTKRRQKVAELAHT